MQQIKAIVKGPYEPQDNQVLWIDTSNPDKITEKVFEGGKWKMTQTAQQDHLKIHLGSFDSLTSDEKEIIKKLIQQDTIWDVLFIVGDVEPDTCRLVTLNESGKVIQFCNTTNEAVIGVSYAD